MDIAALTYDLQKPYVPTITIDICLEHVNNVLLKEKFNMLY